MHKGANGRRMDSTAIGTAANLVTLVIVAITAFAALRQMRHNQMANELEVFTTFVRELNEPEMSARLVWMMDLAERLNDPDYRERFLADAIHDDTLKAVTVLQFFERYASLVIVSGLSEHLILYEFFGLITRVWESSVAAYPLLRRVRGGHYAGRSFEHLAMRAQRYKSKGLVRDYERLLRDPRTIAMDAKTPDL
jgi:hypothetical protein